MDPTRLPERALIDTGVLVRALDRTMTDEWVREFWQAMLNTDKRILVATPSLAEFIRRPRGVTDFPTVRQVELVAFDTPAAITLGQSFPMPQLGKHADQELSKTHLKYDAMIIACAVRWKADCDVYIDRGFKKLCDEIAFTACMPRDFRSTQMSMEFPEP